MAKNILSARLRTLVAGGILESVPAPDGGAHNEYELTEKGRELFPVIVALRQWGEARFFEPGEPHSELTDRRQGLPLLPLEVRAHDGFYHTGRDGRHQARRHHDTPPPAGPVDADCARRCC